MTGSKVLLDTNVVIEIFKNNQPILDALDLYSYNINTVTLGELQVGIYRVDNRVQHEMLLNDFLSMSDVLTIDETTASLYGEISAELYKKGKPIPTNDIWIAASAKQHGLPLFTKDKHFLQIDGMDLQLF